MKDLKSLATRSLGCISRCRSTNLLINKTDGVISPDGGKGNLIDSEPNFSVIESIESNVGDALKDINDSIAAKQLITKQARSRDELTGEEIKSLSKDELMRRRDQKAHEKQSETIEKVMATSSLIQRPISTVVSQSQ